MATEGFARSIVPVRPSLDTRIAEVGFVLLLILILIGLTPFDARSAAAIKARDAASAAGDMVRQIAFLGTFALIAFAALRKRGVMAVTAIPLALALLLAWCMLSALWSGEPAVVGRRGVLAIVFAASVMMSVDTLGSTRTIMLWRYVMAAVILGDIASSLLIHNAVHLPDDMEAGLAGAWRGLHSHKNAAGAVAATAAAMFFYFALETRRRSDILLCIASVGFLVMTRSKSSLGLLPLAVIVGLLYRVAWRNKLDRTIAAICAALFILLLAVAVGVEWDAIARYLEDPQQFTGRTAIWSAEIAYIRDHPLLGSGFGTFGNTGPRSPIYYYVGSGWVSQIGEGHSGYLEMLVTIGGIGFIIGMAALVLQPFAQFWQPERKDANFNAMLFTFFFFDVLHNFMESDFIQVTAVQWGQILLIIALLRVSRRERAGQGAMTAPFFSVVIPVYNRADVLDVALRSVLSQSEQDFEILVVDDGSEDDPKAVIDAIADPRIHCIRQANGGGGAARNAGIARACGDFIALLDSDDTFLPHHLAAARLALTGTSNTAFYARIVVDRGAGRIILKPPRGIAPGEDMGAYLLCDRGFVPTITTVVPAALARKVLYDTDLREAEDTDFAIRLALEGCTFHMADAPGAVWRDRFDPGRQSAGRSTGRLAQWLERLRPRLTRKAYLGGRGWAVAKGVAPAHPLRALSYYLRALFAGCYGPGLAGIVLLQIFLPDRLYRAIADGAIGWLRAGMQPNASKC